MFKFTKENTEYKVRFYYEEVIDGVLTCCEILKENKSIGLGKALWKKNTKDSHNKSVNFCKDTGRKISLLRAMQDAGIERVGNFNRKVFWDVYFSKVKHA